MTSRFDYTYRDDFIDDVDELVDIDLTGSNMNVSTSITTHDVSAVAVVGASVSASNVVASSITTTQFLSGLTMNAESNLCWGGHSLYEPYPQDTTDWDEVIPFDPDLEGMIDVSWLRKKLTAKDVLTDLWNLAELGIDTAQVVKDLYDFLYPQEQIPQQVLDALQQALDSMDEGGSNTLLRVNSFIHSLLHL